MSDADKLAAYERVVEIIEDALSLERHYRRKRKSFETIEFVRADAYKNIVDRVMGYHAIHEVQSED